MRTRRAAQVGALCLAAFALTAACGGSTNRRSALKDAVRAYNDAIRWGYIHEASIYIPADKRAEFMAGKRRAAATWRVHEVDLRQVHMGANHEKARVVVAITFSGGGDPRTQMHVVEQRWGWKENQWLMVGTRRLKTEDPLSKPGDVY